MGRERGEGGQDEGRGGVIRPRCVLRSVPYPLLRLGISAPTPPFHSYHHTRKTHSPDDVLDELDDSDMAQREGEKRAGGEQRGNTLLMALSPSSHAFRPGRLLPPTTLSSKFSVRPPLPASPQFPPSSPAPTAPVLLLVACLLPPATGITQHDADGSGRWRACVLGEARRVTSALLLLLRSHPPPHLPLLAASNAHGASPSALAAPLLAAFFRTATFFFA